MGSVTGATSLAVAIWSSVVILITVVIIAFGVRLVSTSLLVLMIEVLICG